jgi:hypothetical protein
MQLLAEIINLLSSDSPSLTNALFKSQVLAHRLGESELQRWVSNELKGYANGEDVPEYRIAYVTIQATISDGYTHHHEFVVPMMNVDPKIRERLEKSTFIQSVAVLEQWVVTGKEYAKVIAPESFRVLNSGLNNGYMIERAVGRLSVGTISQILTEIRSRLLDMALQISDRIPKEPESSFLKQIAKDANVSDIFKGAVFGNNNTIVVGNGSIRGVSSVVSKNDSASLVEALKSHAVSPQDVEALNIAIAQDKKHQPVVVDAIGSSVAEWIDSMVKKAAAGAWDVSVQSAASILGAAISAYYGIGKA